MNTNLFEWLEKERGDFEGTCKIFTALAAGSTCATTNLPDVSVKSASQVAALHVCVKELC